MFCKKAASRPDKATDRGPSPPLPGAGCVQREIQLSVLIHFYILCPQGSDEVTKSSVRIQRYTFKLDRCAAKKDAISEFDSSILIQTGCSYPERENQAPASVSFAISSTPSVCGQEQTW